MAAEDVEDPIGKGGKVYKGKYRNTCITPHPPSPSAYIYMDSLLLYCNVFSNVAPGTLPQNSQNSPIAYRHLNRPMNHWIDALSHFHLFP